MTAKTDEKVEKKAAKKSETASGAGEKRCSVEGCKRPYQAKGYCVTHYRKWRRGELDKKPRYRTCGEENCRKPAYRKGYCEQHYSAWSASKKPQAPAAVETPAATPAETPAETPKAEEAQV